MYVRGRDEVCVKLYDAAGTTRSKSKAQERKVLADIVEFRRTLVGSMVQLVGLILKRLQSYSVV